MKTLFCVLITILMFSRDSLAAKVDGVYSFGEGCSFSVETIDSGTAIMVEFFETLEGSNCGAVGVVEFQRRRGNGRFARVADHRGDLTEVMVWRGENMVSWYYNNRGNRSDIVIARRVNSN